MKITFFLVIVLLGTFLLNAQNITISGTITDAYSGEKIINVLVLEKNSQRQTSTNNFGFYSLSVPVQDSCVIFVSNFGYENFEENLIIKNNLQKDISLVPTTNEIEEITISANKINDPSTGILTLSPKQISLIPALGGERDIFKSFQLMPGVMQGTEGKSGLYVRGGSPDQNLIILDDVPLYSIEHFNGFFSVFNDDAIKTAKLIKGNFPARYGGRLSSVIDVRMKDGNMKKTTGTISTGFLTTKICLEGPLIKDKISFMFSIRRSMIDLFLTPYYAIDRGDYFNYVFYDINSKLNYKVSDKDNIYLSFYTGDDRFTNSYSDKGLYSKTKDAFSMRGGNSLLAFRWNHIFNNKLFGNLTLNYTKFRYFNSSLTEDIENGKTTYKIFNSIESSISDYAAKYDFEYSIAMFYKINFGVLYTRHIFNPSAIKYSDFMIDREYNVDTFLLSQNFNSNEFNTYIENIIKISDFFSANIGFRESIYFIDSKEYISHEPRIILNFSPFKKISFKGSYAKTSQNIHLMVLNNVNFFSSIWVPATEKCPPEYSNIYSLAFVTSLFKNFDIEIEFYQKEMSNLIEFAKGSFYSNASDWENKSEKNGVGHSYGLEFFINKKIGRLTGWIGYSYSKTTRQFENINSGKVYPYDFDRPHDFKIFVNYKIKENLDFSVAWYFQSGRPINMPIGYYYSYSFYNFDFENNIPIPYNNYTELFTDKNSFRMKPYHRLDIALNWTKEKKRGFRTLSFGIYNVYNRLNAHYYYFDTITNNGIKERVLYQYALLPIIPSISYTFKFK